MSEESLDPKFIMDRRGFIKRSIVAVAGIATLTTLSRPTSLRRSNVSKDTGSIFAPRPGSKLNYWRNRFNNFRLK